MERRKQLFDGLVAAQSAKGGGGNYNYGSPSGPMRTAAYTADENKLTQQGNAASEFNRTRDQKFGESGYMGQMENPEYLAGRAMNWVLNPMVDRLQYYIHDGDSIAESLTHREERQAALAASRAVSPLLPYNPAGAEAKDKAYHQVRGMADAISPKSYDQYYRKKTGSYPSLAGSHMASFLENLLDPVSVLTAASIIKSSGSSAAKPLLKEIAQEAPMYAGIVGAGYAATPAAAKQMPSWFESGNHARTDLYQYDPVTQKPREQTAGEFRQAMRGKEDEQAKARHQLESWQRNKPKAPYGQQ
jgi:hypothetical protein